MQGMIAHAGGWDELLISAAAVAAFIGLRLLAERRRARRESREDGG
jgi:hypothetical protein